MALSTQTRMIHHPNKAPLTNDMLQQILSQKVQKSPTLITEQQPTQYIPQKQQQVFQPKWQKQQAKPGQKAMTESASAKISNELSIAIMLDNEQRFTTILDKNQALFVMEPSISSTVIMKIHRNKSGGGHDDTILHIAVLQYLKNPYYLRYLLTFSDAQVPHLMENTKGHPAFFLLSSYSDDRCFEALLTDFIKERPQLDLNYRSSITNESLFELVMLKCPSFTKYRIMLDFNFQLEKESFTIGNEVIELLNRSTYAKCGLEEKKRIVGDIVRRTEVKRKEEFVKVYENTVREGVFQGVTMGMLREIVKYL
ncbi:hypothetical protein FGO68_gene7388 [Halteria grandinella]|uniref:Uncharacterized protein n=1 Tax=Halteria grandinella TaxID=5974 RepID=A0A8J8SZU8_HALGN|nr:hypothetical protein FGO68_gene7388 [Halteria grandinella]